MSVVKIGVTAIRTVRFHLLELAYFVAQKPKLQGFLVLPEVELREDRIRAEWEMVAGVLRPYILSRLGIWAGRGESWFGIPTEPNRRTQQILKKHVGFEMAEAGPRQIRADLSFVVLELLVHHWLLGKGPLRTNTLMEMAGCSYPSVAKALRLVRNCLTRHSDRRVELNRFPKEEWARMVAVAERARGTVRFADRSGQSRSVESLLRRLQRLDRADIALGGVVGAKHYHPALDLVGIPRLDLSLHCWGKEPDWSFVERLDPGLARVEGTGEPPSLVVHLVRRKEPLFEHGTEGWQYADPVECLLDLHEARLESQAQELLDTLRQQKAKHE